ncbi:MAG: hypothetical protein M0P39_04680 [Rhodocyclaceae bacterium]|jgi:hypothetical protein|nr:hypothetical protein [Rhodocyclaceae bacterium]
MLDTVFCYHCQARHSRDEMRQVVSKTGKRWRCAKSIAAAKNDLAAREAFGRQVTAMNKSEAQAKIKHLLNPERATKGR